MAPEKLPGALLLQAFYSVRSERQLMEQLTCNMLFRWLVGAGTISGRLAARASALLTSTSVLPPIFTNRSFFSAP
jgi:transposase